MGPQAVDEKADEGREVMADWDDVWEDTRGFGGEFGGPVYSFAASNAARSPSLNEGYIVVGGF